jgi:hypothetical protein
MSRYAPNPMRMLSWNMAHREAHWHNITNDGDLDVALLQEAVSPPPGRVLETIPAADGRWVTAGGIRHFCAAIARLSDRVTLRPIRTSPIADAGRDELAVSLSGTLAACEVVLESGEQITVVSIYGAWTSPIPWKEGGWIYADASVHRLISDLSALVASQHGHRIIVAGDLKSCMDMESMAASTGRPAIKRCSRAWLRWACRSSDHSTRTASSAHPGHQNYRATARTFRRSAPGGPTLQALPDSSILSLRRLISRDGSKYAHAMLRRNGDQVITVAWKSIWNLHGKHAVRGPRDWRSAGGVSVG